MSIHASLVAAREFADQALEQLTPNTEYLRDELEAHFERLCILIGKLERDAALTRDRDFLLSPDPPAEGIAEYLSNSEEE